MGDSRLCDLAARAGMVVLVCVLLGGSAARAGSLVGGNTPAGNTPGVVRNSVWYLNLGFDGTAEIGPFSYGNAGDIPVAGDWDGDGIDTPGVVRGSVWYLNNNFDQTSDIPAFSYGNVDDVPVVGDWDGDVVDTPGVVRGTVWYLNNNFDQTSDIPSFSYGLVGDLPVVGDWDDEGVDTPGLVRGNVWYLNNNFDGTADISAFSYGDPSDLKISGNWDGPNTRFGHYFLREGTCCGGDPLRGTRATIRPVNVPNNSEHCVAFRSAAERSPKVINAGYARCAPGWSVGRSGFTCSGFLKFVEHFDASLIPPSTCFAKGSVTVGVDVRYTVQMVTPGIWRAFLDGIADPNDFSMGDAKFLFEGGEWPSRCEPFSATGRFGVVNVWNRHNGASWIQSHLRTLG